MEAVYSDYAGQSVDFYYVYKKLAHPGVHGYMEAYNVQDRLAHIQEAKRTLETRIPWLADSQSDDLFNSLGQSFNAEFVFNPQGEIVRMRDWSNPTKLRNDLEQLVGPASGVGTAKRVNRRVSNARPKFPRGVVARVAMPGGMKHVTISPRSSDHPFYAKVSVWANTTLIDVGSGTLCVEVVLDPVHAVHWNNRAPGMTIELVEPNSRRVLASRQAPRGNVDADIDPRRVLVELDGLATDKPVHLHVRYITCDDAQTWCKFVSQSYLMHLSDGIP